MRLPSKIAQVALYGVLVSTLAYPQAPSPKALISQPSARHTPSQAPKACDLALSGCLRLSKAQDASIANLKSTNNQLALALAQATKPPLLPTWALISLSVLAGFAAAKILTK